MRTTEWVLIDTETSGLGQPIYCVEIAARRMKGIDPDGPAFRALLNHDVDIEPQAEALHGYSRRFLRANGRDPVEVHREFNAYVGARPVVAYNLSFDWARVLEPEVRRLGMSPSYRPGFCALTLARRCVHETDGHKLDTLRSYFFPDHGGPSHHALDDVEVTTKLIVEIIWPRLARAGIESFSLVADFSRKTPVRGCIDLIRNPKPLSRLPAPVARDVERELATMIEGMLADDQIVDAEVWTLKHWLDTHAEHRSEMAARSRELIAAAFADGELSHWELNEIKDRLGQLIGSKDRPPRTQTSRCTQPNSTGSEPNVEKKRRLSLTKRQLEQETGAALLKLLGEIVADGVLSHEEIEKLTQWLSENQSQDLPAIVYLREVLNEIVADGKITDSERIDLFLGIEKVLPVAERRTAKTARQHAEARAERENLPKISREELETMATEEELPRSSSRANWRLDPMTDAQSAFIRSLGGSIGGSATKGEASDLINALLGEKPITSRQQMVMRFWARERQSGEGPREISEWMDQFYREDGDRKLAWELFKNESEDNGLQGDPSRVPLGVGPEYLARIKAGGEAAIPRFRSSSPASTPVDNVPLRKQTKQSPTRTVIVAGVLTVAAIIGIISFVFRDEGPTESSQPSFTPPSSKTAPEKPSPSAKAASAAGGDSRSENQAVVRRLRIVGLIGGSRPRVSMEGKLLGVGDVVNEQRGILVHSINAETRTITFIDVSGEIYSRTLN